MLPNFPHLKSSNLFLRKKQSTKNFSKNIALKIVCINWERIPEQGENFWLNQESLHFRYSKVNNKTGDGFNENLIQRIYQKPFKPLPLAPPHSS